MSSGSFTTKTPRHKKTKSNAALFFWYNTNVGKKALKKRIASLLKRISEHESKLNLERLKETPDDGLIQHWQVEIEAFKANINKAKKRVQS